MSDDPTPAAVGFRSERGPVLAAIMTATSLVALESTIIATAVPSIVKDLGGFAQFPWLFSAYLLTQAVTVPLYGKFADMVGRRPVMFFGIAVFLAGSVLGGLAWSMPALIAARVLQGIGAGAVLPMSITIVGDLYTVEERARVQGYVASVWAGSAVVGPALGGVFADYLHWRWIFFINLPLGAAAVWMLWTRFQERVERRPHRIDVAGAILLMTGCSLLVLGLIQGGVSWDWGSGVGVGVFAGAAGLLVLFAAVERRAAEPVLPVWVLSRRILAGGNLTSFVIGVVLMGMTTYVPTYVQGVLGTGAVMAGFAVAALTLGWPLSAALSGRIYLRIGFRNTALIGAVLAVAAGLWSTKLGPESMVLTVAAVCFVVGAALGLLSVPTLVASQSVVGWDRRGVVTATNMFARNIGAAVGAAVFGAVVNATLANRLADPPAAVADRIPRADGVERILLGAEQAPAAVAEFLRGALYDAVHNVFIGVPIVAALAFAALALMPRHTEPLRFDESAEPAAAAVVVRAD